MVPSFSFALTEKCDSVVELLAESSTSGGRDFDTTIKFNASKGEEFDTGVALDAKLVCFAPSSLFSRDQQATVGSLFLIVHYCRIIHYCWMHREKKPWRRVWSISSHLHLIEQSNTYKSLVFLEIYYYNAVYRDVDEYSHKEIKTSRKKKKKVSLKTHFVYNLVAPWIFSRNLSI